MSNIVINPIPFFSDLGGKPLQNGALYFGVANTNPVTNPVTVYQDEACTIPLQQPVKVSAGVPVLNGSPTPIYTNGELCSMLVNDGSGRVVMSQPSVSNPLSIAQSIISQVPFAVNSIGSLRTLSKLTYSQAVVLGSASSGDGNGGGTYYLDPGDTTSADNGTTIIVANDGGRWKMASTLSTYSDNSVRITANDSSLFPGQQSRGYFYQYYQSSNPGPGSLFGYAANVQRTGGNRIVVPAQLNGYAIDQAGQPGGTVWGIATEAWNGDSTYEPVLSNTLVGAEFAVFSQYHANTSPIVGADHVFYNRAGSATDVLHGSAGNNQFNKNSMAIKISNGFNHPRPPSGAYSGWNKGIYFDTNSLDQSVDGGAIGIDMGDVNTSIMKASLKLPGGVPVILGTVAGPVYDGFVYNSNSLSPYLARRIDFVRDIGGTDSGANLVVATLSLSLSGPSGTIMAYSSIGTTVGAAGSASPLPATPTKYIHMRDINDGVLYAIPLYAAS